MNARVSITPDAQWFRAALTIPAGTLSGTDLMDQLAAAFAEDPDGITERLLSLHELNRQTERDVEEGREMAADQSAAQAMSVRRDLALDLPLDVTVWLDEAEARDLSDAALAAARSTFSARISAGYDPARKATPLRSVA